MRFRRIKCICKDFHQVSCPKFNKPPEPYRGPVVSVPACTLGDIKYYDISGNLVHEQHLSIMLGRDYTVSLTTVFKGDLVKDE